MKATTVVIADPQLVVAEALTVALSTHEDLNVLDSHPSSAAELVRAVEQHCPHVVVAEYWLKELRGPAATRAVHARRPDTKVIVLSWLLGAEQVMETLRAGACGFLPKNCKLDELADGIRAADAGEWPIFKERLERMVGRIGSRAEIVEQATNRLAQLTPRQMEVLELLAAGLDAQDISKRLGLTLVTVRSYISDVLHKTHSRSQIEAVALARNQGLLP